MMGVGKSSIGKDLSHKLKMEFKDIDSIIEKKLSLSISEIFKKKGEKFFRDIEEKESGMMKFAREVESSKKLYESFLQRVKETNEAQNLQVSKLKMIFGKQ